MAVEWHYLASGFPRGPISSQQLRDLVGVAAIDPSTPIRRVSGDEASPWRRAGEVKGLFPDHDVARLGDPICEACGSRLKDGRCRVCMPAPPPPPPPPQIAPTRARAPSAPSSVEKYEHLRSYMALMQRSATIIFGGTILIAVLIIGLAAEQEFLNPFTFLMLVIMVALAYSYYVFVLAIVQFVQVIMDIEANTRQTELNTRGDDHP